MKNLCSLHCLHQTSLEVFSLRRAALLTENVRTMEETCYCKSLKENKEIAVMLTNEHHLKSQLQITFYFQFNKTFFVLFFPQKYVIKTWKKKSYCLFFEHIIARKFNLKST